MKAFTFLGTDKLYPSTYTFGEKKSSDEAQTAAFYFKDKTQSPHLLGQNITS